MRGFREVEVKGDLGYGLSGMYEVVPYFKEQPLLQKLSCGNAELPLHCRIDRNPADVQQAGIEVHSLVFPYVGFQQLLELVCIVIFRPLDG